MLDIPMPPPSEFVIFVQDRTTSAESLSNFESEFERSIFIANRLEKLAKDLTSEKNPNIGLLRDLKNFIAYLSRLVLVNESYPESKLLEREIGELFVEEGFGDNLFDTDDFMSIVGSSYKINWFPAWNNDSKMQIFSKLDFFKIRNHNIKEAEKIVKFINRRKTEIIVGILAVNVVHAVEANLLPRKHEIIGNQNTNISSVHQLTQNEDSLIVQSSSKPQISTGPYFFLMEALNAQNHLSGQFELSPSSKSFNEEIKEQVRHWGSIATHVLWDLMYSSEHQEK